MSDESLARYHRPLFRVSAHSIRMQMQDETSKLIADSIKCTGTKPTPAEIKKGMQTMG